ncbi:dihydrofolate reductase family protein [Rubellicoccus peritrichatus]|uniref:Dihydrofolate reductase family protein n=1 Tax=Rubellicoccus peritrichatus TaxID=3080537 RepID=A0AAQ3QX25_9BACT|nr:dihydrofolate reductase family protein [Puniceicoccus sp. CR14]WOO42450.1 dihydrofolate reductase family protein [Puniceicoccus sp. CR14]
MRKIAILTFLTLDGVMQGPSSPEEDSSGGFARGGWAVNYWEDVMAQVMGEAMAEPYDLLLGRKTYEIFASHWPNVGDNPVANILNNANKFVVTSALDQLEWKNTIPLTGNVVSEVTRLKEQEGPLLQIHGSWQLIQTLLAHGLVDEFRLWTFPVMVGGGKRLFSQDALPTGLKLVKTKATSSGVIMSIYRREQV